VDEERRAAAGSAPTGSALHTSSVQAGSAQIRRVVIVGAGLGGLLTAEQLRRQGYAGEIVMIGAEAHPPYDRPPLSKRFLHEASQPVVWLRGDTFHELDITLHVGEPAEALSVADHVVTTARRAVRYDVAVLATGAVSRRVPGLNGLTLRTLDDAVRLRTELVPGRRLGIVGAGLIGCEVAASARALGLDVHLADVADGPAVRVLGPRVADRLAQLHIEHGVALHFGVAATRPRPDQLLLTDGTELAVDLVLEAVGAVPDTAWLADADVALGDGVLCDEHGLAAPNVYAVGDIARWGAHRHEHWTAAADQAAHVVSRILGLSSNGPGVPYWWSDQYDIKLQGLGIPDADDEVTEVICGPKKRPVALYSRDDRLTGVVGFSAAGVVMRLRDDIARGAAVDDVVARLG
jgi:3-phenylpropionate/trans-cinnamate dioxygenase ferredoxin reductase subunit